MGSGACTVKGAATPVVLGLAMIATAIGVQWLQPELLPAAGRATLAQSIPVQFGDWQEVPFTGDQIDPGKGTADEPNMDRPYDDLLMRAYGNSRGDVVLLAVAYGRNQRQEVKIHRPDVCYTAQGFQLVERSPVSLPVSGAAIHGMRMLVKAPGRTEAVSYWIRIGEVFTENAWSIRYHIFKQGLAGKAVDGVLVRASRIEQGSGPASGARYAVQEQFLGDLVRALPPQARRLLLG
jgi:EpsI family protein